VVDPFEIPKIYDPFIEPAGETFNIYTDQPSTLQAEPIIDLEPMIDLQSSSEPLAEPETEEQSEPVETSATDYVTSHEAASLLGMNLNHLRQLTFQKKLHVAKREGRRSLYSLTAINEYKEKQNAKP
jgi:hypothetical protein